MVAIHRWHLLLVAIAFSSLGTVGCQNFYPLPNDPVPCTSRIWVNPSEEPTPEWAMLPQQSKNKVYVYLLNGNDPLNTGNLLGVRDYLQARGFIKTTYGQQFHGPWFVDDIASIHEADPTAHFILVGFSAAAGPVNQMARRLGEKGISIDCLIYLDGVFLLRPEEYYKPDNVKRFVSVHSQGWLVHGSDHEGAQNFEIENTGHFDIPSHPRTLQVVMEEVTKVACQVPVLVDLPPPLREGRRPTPLMPTQHHLPPDWEFLQPDLMGSRALPSSVISYKPVSKSSSR